MKILNISYVVPIKGNKDENDIILRVQDHLKKVYGYKFEIIKFLPYSNNLLALFKKKWSRYNQLAKKNKIKVGNYSAYIFRSILPPTSNAIINYFFIPLNYIYYKFFLKNKLLPLAKKNDLILAQNFFPDTVYAYFLHKDTSIPFIINIRDPLPSFFVNMPFVEKVIKNSKKIITPSPTYYNRFRKKLDIRFIPHPIEDDFFKPSIKKIENGIIQLITVSRLIKLKNIDKVIECLIKLNNLNYKFNYHIVGDGPEREKLEKLVKKNSLDNAITFHGKKDYSQIIKLLDSSSIFILPSNPETLGRSFLEASSRDCICVGFENTGVDGLFKDNESAFFVNEKTIYSTLKYIIDNLSDEMYQKIINNSKNIVKNMNWKTIGENYDQEFRKII